MAYTLISMIGTGKAPGNPNGYVETDYDFGNGKHFTTRLFMQAVLQSRKDIDQIILLGTDTSSWESLVDVNDGNKETENLWYSLAEKTEGKDKDILGKLSEYLTKRFNQEVIIDFHTHKVDDSTSEELFNCYTGITKRVKSNNNILFDITHGFRSMPILLYQSLQYSLSKACNRDVEIIYGELDHSDNDKSIQKGYARSLSSYWNYSEFSNALDVFESKLDGFRLAELISSTWEKGSKAIKRLSEIVQTNFALQIFDVARQIKNALDVYPENAPNYLLRVKEMLNSIVKLIDESNKALSLVSYSEFLYHKKLNVQAVITLQIAVEAAIVAKYGKEEDCLGDYDWWQDYGRKQLYDLKGNNWKAIGSPLKNLESVRNQIAHGGYKNSETGGFPNAANIPNIYESGKRGVENLFKELGL